MTVLKRRESHIFERDANDWYVEPPWVSDALFGAEEFDGTIWDPACGQGNIVEEAHRSGLTAVGTDIKMRNYFHGQRDFLKAELSVWTTTVNIVMNPPFGRAVLAERFIRHAIYLRPRKIAVFVDARFVFGRARAKGLFAEFPPARIWIITPRPSCPPGEYLKAGNKAGGGTADYVWLVWDKSANSKRGFGWLIGASK